MYYRMYCGRVPAANAPGCTTAEGLLYKPWSLVVLTCTARCLHQRDPSSDRRNCLGEKWPVISTESCDFHAYTFGFFYMPQICDKQLYFPSEGRHAEDFFALKNPTASAGLNPRTWVPKASTLPQTIEAALPYVTVRTGNDLHFTDILDFEGTETLENCIVNVLLHFSYDYLYI